jgi:hypothetical protein
VFSSFVSWTHHILIKGDHMEGAVTGMEGAAPRIRWRWHRSMSTAAMRCGDGGVVAMLANGTGDEEGMVAGWRIGGAPGQGGVSAACRCYGNGGRSVGRSM